MSNVELYSILENDKALNEKGQPGKVANPARDQLHGEMNISLSPVAPENLVSRDGFGRPVPRQPAHITYL